MNVVKNAENANYSPDAQAAVARLGAVCRFCAAPLRAAKPSCCNAFLLKFRNKFQNFGNWLKSFLSRSQTFTLTLFLMEALDWNDIFV